MNNEPNPYSPSQVQGGPPMGPADPGDKQHLQKVASAQRMVMYALLTNICMYILALTGLLPQIALSVIGLVALGFTIFAMFSLGKELHGTGAGVVFALVMIIPCVSLLVMLVVNQQATKLLTSNGYNVGLMGASKGQFS